MKPLPWDPPTPSTDTKGVGVEVSKGYKHGHRTSETATREHEGDELRNQVGAARAAGPRRAGARLRRRVTLCPAALRAGIRPRRSGSGPITPCPAG
eukprot:750121-Hanusia_phi.AAC.1